MSRKQIWIIVAAGLVFALIFGVRQSVALFIGPLNSATGLGIAAISLAFACAQLMWGITQPIAGAVADKYGTGRVIAAGGAPHRRDRLDRRPDGAGLPLARHRAARLGAARQAPACAGRGSGGKNH